MRWVDKFNKDETFQIEEERLDLKRPHDLKTFAVGYFLSFEMYRFMKKQPVKSLTCLNIPNPGFPGAVSFFFPLSPTERKGLSIG